ncbi:hypothetical protein CI109_100757 [Kwoniella shandongensis]|uniref:Uncharacterized protein n=1 Tax=Kwoniella shandongensis TaxID=1734106 RepID=A0A5M6BTH2_9TREE|nr:uncharacterized protein CI109_007370 [Kwoniella shandongensis]KAA5524299.1 hypothetical protein CI109_007370 [Kwoniella shandongensis]
MSTTTSPTIVLFARGTLALLDLWPALTIAVTEQWGGPDSSEKKTWLASTLIDEFESRATYLPSPAGTSSTGAAIVDPATANDPPLDHDDIADLLTQILSDEFDANLEDGSIDSVASDLVRLWRDLLASPTGADPETLVRALEGKADEVRKTGVKASSGGDADTDGEDADSDDDGEEGMDVDEAPALVPAQPKEKEEPVVDEDGFTLVQKPKRR